MKKGRIIYVMTSSELQRIMHFGLKVLPHETVTENPTFWIKGTGTASHDSYREAYILD